MVELVGGRYEVLGVLGSGSMGVVWRAVDTVLGREVALKELRAPEGLDAGEAVDRFVTEARAAAGLSHPSIVTVHDVFAEADRVLMSMELLVGETLAEVLSSGGGLGGAARGVMTEVAGALAVAHRAGVVHRDLKPENVFLLGSGRVVVCDFGLARIGAGRGTQVGTVMGTPGYMAPEQLKGLEVGAQADVFAWGAVAYELASGVPAFGDPATEDFVSLSYRVAHVDPAPLVFEDDELFGEVIAAALVKDPEGRLADGDVLLRALNGGVVPAGSGSGIGGASRVSSLPPVVSSLPPSVPKRSNGVLVGVGVGAVVLVAVIALVVVLMSGSTPETAAFTDVTTRATTNTTTTTTTPPPTVTARRLAIGAVTGTSQAPDGVDAAGNTTTFNAANVIDGRLDTAWRTPGQGIGARLSISSPAASAITRVGLVPGYAKVDPNDGTDRFVENRRVRLVRWHFSDGTSIDQTFSESPVMQYLDVKAPGGPMEIEILDVTGHAGRDFVAISELEIWGT